MQIGKPSEMVQRSKDRVPRSNPLANAKRRLCEPDLCEHPLLGGYQQQIAELECTVTYLRQRLADLNASVSATVSSHAHLNDLFQNAPVGYVIHDATGIISGINYTARSMLGIRNGTDEVSFSRFVPKSQVGAWLAHLRSANTSLLATTDLMLRGANNNLIPVQLSTLAFASPTSPKVFRTILSDISQRRAAESALASTQQDYHHLIDTIEGIVWEADARTLDVTFVSGYAERLLGYNVRDWKLPGFWPNRIYLDDRERVVNELARAVANRQPLRVDYRVRAADRRLLWLHDNITTLEREGRLYLLGVAVDVTRQREDQDVLRHNQELLEERVQERTAELRSTVQELESFSYSISHDLRAPLRSMLGFAEMALKVGGDQLSPQVKGYLERIKDGGLRADHLVQDVLAYSRVSRANFQLVPVDLDRLVPNLIAQYPDFQSPKAIVRVQKPLLTVLGHEALLGQCITNLLANAVKFVPPGVTPEIAIRTEPAKDPRRTLLWFEDNGIGIEPENLARIFNMFERIHSTREYTGTGIGLAIVRKGCERMNGTVGVESEPGKGSKFWMELKAA